MNKFMQLLVAISILIVICSSNQGASQTENASTQSLKEISDRVKVVSDSLKMTVIANLFADIENAIKLSDQVVNEVLNMPDGGDQQAVFDSTFPKIMRIKEVYNDLNQRSDYYRTELTKGANSFTATLSSVEQLLRLKERAIAQLNEELSRLQQQPNPDQNAIENLKLIIDQTDIQRRYITAGYENLQRIKFDVNSTKEAIDQFIEQGRWNSRLIDAIAETYETQKIISEHLAAGKGLAEIGDLTARMRESMIKLAETIQGFMHSLEQKLFPPF